MAQGALYEAFVEALSEKQKQGMTVQEAATAVWVELRTAGEPSERKVALSQAVGKVYRTTPRELVIVLTALGFSIEEVAIGVVEGMRVQGITLSATDLGAALLDPQGFPDTDRRKMQSVLSGCGYSAAEVAKAVKILYPLTVTVQSTKPWQDTGIAVEPDEIVLLEAGSDRWYISPQCGLVGAAGGTRRISFSSYAMPGEPEGAMIARVGDKVLLAGMRLEIPAGVCGTLALCPNDDLTAAHGEGLRDNRGSIPVKITVRLR